MISDWELWACAQQIVKHYGAGAADHAKKRMADLAEAGDETGGKIWLALAERVDLLTDYQGTGRTRH